MRVKIFTTLCLTAVALMMGAAAPLSAQTKIALVDFQGALLATAEMQAEAAKLEQEFKPRQDELQKLTTDMQALQQQIAAATDPQQQANLQADGARMQRRFDRLREDLQADVDFRRDGVLQKGAVRLREVLEKMRVEKGLDLIIDGSSVYVASASLDITGEVISAYDAAHPATP